MRKRLITTTPETVWFRAVKAGWRSGGWQSLRSPQRRKTIPSRLHSFREKRQAGAPPSRARKRSGSCLISRKRLKRISLVFEEKETGRKSSSYVGLPMAGARFGKLFASSGISALLRQYARSKNIKLSCQTSPYSNWQLCRIRVAEVLAPLSRVCACFDSRPCFSRTSKELPGPRVLAP